MKNFLLIIGMIITLLVSSMGNAYGQATKPVWIDVRTQAEYDAGHLASAILIPYDVISKKITGVIKNKNQLINLYCRSGRRSEIALKTLEQLGYNNVQNLGAYEELKKAGFP